MYCTSSIRICLCFTKKHIGFLFTLINRSEGNGKIEKRGERGRRWKEVVEGFPYENTLQSKSTFIYMCVVAGDRNVAEFDDRCSDERVYCTNTNINVYFVRPKNERFVRCSMGAHTRSHPHAHSQMDKKQTDISLRIWLMRPMS